MWTIASRLPLRMRAMHVVPSPSRSRSRLERSVSSSWASMSASRSSGSIESAGWESVSRGTRWARATEEAMSPPAGPPMPSARTNRLAPA